LDGAFHGSSNSSVPVKRSHEEDSDEEGEVIGISEVLHDLNAKKPDLNYLQYEGTLREKGIMYADAVADIDNTFLEVKVGMAKGAIGAFRKAARQAAKGKMVKQICLDEEKENVRPGEA